MFKVGDRVVALKDRPEVYNVTTDKVVCEVIALRNRGEMTVVVLGDENRFDYTVEQQYFRHARPAFKGNTK